MAVSSRLIIKISEHANKIASKSLFQESGVPRIVEFSALLGLKVREYLHRKQSASFARALRNAGNDSDKTGSAHPSDPKQSATCPTPSLAIALGRFDPSQWPQQGRGHVGINSNS